MFIFAKSTKERVITAGVLIACCIFVTLSIRFACEGKYALILSLLGILIPIAILKGLKLGYIIARFVFGGATILFAVNVVNPLAYVDIGVASIPFWQYASVIILLAAISAFLYYCLNEHAKLRELK